MTLIHAPANALPTWPYDLQRLRQDRPNVSFAANPSREDLSHFDVFEVESATPPDCDPRTQRLEEVHPELVDGTWQQRWTIRDATPDEIAAYDEANRPAPDWSEFKRQALTHPGLNAAIAAALPLAPAAALALPAALLRAEAGAVSDFAGCWRAIVAVVPSANAMIPELLAAAQACNLPVEFIEAVQPAWLERARDDQGRFIADDPATPEDEAWVPASPD